MKLLSQLIFFKIRLVAQFDWRKLFIDVSNRMHTAKRKETVEKSKDGRELWQEI